MSIWITYDPGGSFPQAPRLEGRNDRPRHRHFPPDGLVSFEVNRAELVHGADKLELLAFYEVTAPDTLTPKDQATVDALKSAWQAERVRRNAREPNAAGRLDTFLEIPAIRGIKTLGDADAFIDGQVTDLASAKDAMGKLLFALVNLARYARVDADQIFPADE